MRDLSPHSEMGEETRRGNKSMELMFNTNFLQTVQPGILIFWFFIYLKKKTLYGFPPYSNMGGLVFNFDHFFHHDDIYFLVIIIYFLLPYVCSYVF